jgi:thioesterase domain-containing protein
VQHATVITQLCERFIASLDDAVMYTEDFLVELQNALLGDLFGKAVTHRKPLDPTKKVITFQQADELEKWFATSTEWGREVARIEAETAARFFPGSP